MLASILRTLVPLIVGWVLALPVVSAAGVTEDDATRAVQVLVTVAYYLLARLAEEYVSPRFGWLLGLAKRPTYANAKTIPGDLAGD